MISVIHMLETMRLNVKQETIELETYVDWPLAWRNQRWQTIVYASKSEVSEPEREPGCKTGVYSL